MIEKLRKRIIAINVITAGIILFVSVVITFTLGYGRINAERSGRLATVLSYDEATAEVPFEENPLFKDMVLVHYDLESEEIVSLNIGSGANWNMNRLTKDMLRIVHSDAENGWLRMHIKYVKVVDGNLVKIAFNNLNSYDNGLMSYIWWVLGALILGLSFYLLFSIMLASMAISPIEKAWSSQKQFVADASHELKTPLSVIMANTEMLASHQDETVESQMKWIENTQSEAKRMAGLVADLLILAKNDEGLQVQMDDVDLSDCVGSVVLGYEALFYENNKTFNYNISPDLIVEGNASQLQQLTNILLDNAGKYSKKQGNITLTLSTYIRHALLTVSNDSDELSDEQLEKLFDRFYTVDTSRNKSKGGNGLGLSIAKMICEAHGGDISVQYLDGRITFTAKLPIAHPLIILPPPKSRKKK